MDTPNTDTIARLSSATALLQQYQLEIGIAAAQYMQHDLSQDCVVREVKKIAEPGPFSIFISEKRQQDKFVICEPTNSRLISVVPDRRLAATLSDLVCGLLFVKGFTELVVGVANSAWNGMAFQLCEPDNNGDNTRYWALKGFQGMVQ
jgi:hypothetical protein